MCNTKKTAALLTNQQENHRTRSVASQESQTALRLNDAVRSEAIGSGSDGRLSFICDSRSTTGASVTVTL